MRRSRSRNRSGQTRHIGGLFLSVCLIGAVLFSGMGAPEEAFSTATIDRSASMDVVSDMDGVIKLNVTSELQEGTDGECLVRITNNLEKEVTVNVSLRNDSDHLGDLWRDDILGLLKGDSIEFNLASEATKKVKMNVNKGTAGNTTYFHVTATAPGVSVTLRDRSAPIYQSANTTCA